MTDIRRQFITVTGRWGSRQVHYRHCGTGPAVVLLHQSPQSSRELEPLMQQWSSRFTLLAPDSPGYGLSDPLGIDAAELDDFAAATLEFVDALGIDRFGIYGFHTGGMIGMAVADCFPARVSALACNGVVVPTAAELADLLEHYLPPVIPRWDGGHLAWLWARIREQAIFFPWHSRRLECRMDFAMPGPEHQQRSLLEFLRAGAHYHVAYHAAFIYRADLRVSQLQVPSVITASRGDPLQAHLGRLGLPPERVAIAAAETPEAALQSCVDLLQQYPGDTLPALPASSSSRPAPERCMVATPVGQLHLWQAGPADATCFVLLHPPGASGDALTGLLHALAPHAMVIVPDLPGHGESGPLTADDNDVLEHCVEAVLAILKQAAIARPHLVGIGGGCVVAMALAQRLQSTVGGLYLKDPLLLDVAEQAEWRRDGTPAMTAEWSGGHLLRCWHMVRDSRLYFPWFRRDRTSIRWHEPDLDDQAIQRDVTDYLKAEGHWQRLLLAQLAWPLRQALGNWPGALCVAADYTSPWHERARQAATDRGLSFETLAGSPDAMARWLLTQSGGA